MDWFCWLFRFKCFLALFLVCAMCGRRSRLLRRRVDGLPGLVRVSVGSAVVLGLLEGKVDVAPTTAYLMTHVNGRCGANCGFCPQARQSRSGSDLLSRVSWPAFSTVQVIEGLGSAFQAGKIRRVCLQALNYSGVFLDLCALVSAIKRRVAVPVSVSCQPMNKQDLLGLLGAGADRVGVALDAATEKLFWGVKGAGALGPYEWSDRLGMLREAVAVFGRGNVSTHLIAGLGETEKEMVGMVQQCVDSGVLPALFAFTPVRGTRFEGLAQPELVKYRRIQLARHLIVAGLARFGDMQFGVEGEIADFGVEKSVLRVIVEGGQPFLTSGCGDCNRPFYNEKPSGPLYNFPRRLTVQETADIKRMFEL